MLCAQVIRAARLEYTDAQRVSLAYNALGLQDSVSLWYSGLGQLARMEFRQPVQSSFGNPASIYSGELLTLDALGNRYESRDSSNVTERVWLRDPLSSPTGQSRVSNTLSAYAPPSGQPAAGRLRTVFHYNRQEEFEYDAAGNAVFRYSANPTDPVETPMRDQAAFYGGDGKLRVSDVEEHPNSRTCEQANSRTRLTVPLDAAPSASDPRRGADDGEVAEDPRDDCPGDGGAGCLGAASRRAARGR